MYQSFFELAAKPFQITSDPKFLWLGEKHSEALATLKYGILENKGFLLLTGDIGTGKTALIKQLIKMIDVAAIVATIPDPELEPLDFFNFLAEEFKMGRKFSGKGDFLIHLKQFLLKAESSQKKVLLIIDEAQRLNNELLEQIRLLSNIELDNLKLINIFFVGQTEFNQTLLNDRNKAVRQRITVSYHIEPLDAAETEMYIRHRLKVAGAKREIFTPDAMRAVYQFSSGYPRLINIICDHAMLTGYADGQETIDVDKVRDCERELRIPISKEKVGQRPPGSAPLLKETATSTASAAGLSAGDASRNSRKAGAAVIFLLLLGFTGYLIYQSQVSEGPLWRMEEIAPQTYEGLSGQKSIPPPPPGTEAATATGNGTPGGSAESPAGPAARQDPTQANSAADTAGTQPARRPNDPVPDDKLIVFFKYNSNEVTDEGFATLDRIADHLVNNPQAKVSVTGYSDAVGSHGYNISVSQFRANAIKSYLVGKGVPSANIEAVGKGSENPIATNDTAEGRQKNRRVEIELATGG